MAIHIYKPRWNVKPPQSAVIDGSTLGNGLIGCWPLSEGGGMTIHDYSGNSNPFTFSGDGASWQPGNKGFGINFTGSGATVGNPVLKKFAVTGYTFFALVSGTYTSNMSPCSQDDNSGVRSWLARVNGPTSIQHFAFNTSVSSTGITGTITAAQLAGGFAFAGGYDTTSNLITLYADGVLLNSGALSGTWFASLQNFYIGLAKTGAESPWNGNIYAVYFWNRALSQAEHQQLAISPFSSLFVNASSKVRYLSAVPAAGGSVIHGRRSLSEFGARGGTRQMQQ